MEPAVEPYRVGSAREIMLSVGLADPADYSRAYQYCKPEHAINKSNIGKDTIKQTRLRTRSKFRTAYDIMQEEVPDGLLDL